MFLIIGILLMKYKPVYEMILEGESVGYIKNKKNFLQNIEKIIEQKEDNIVSVSLETNPEYKWKLVNKEEETKEGEILSNLQKYVVTTYVRYAIVLDGENKGYAKTEKEAEQMVEEIKAEFKDKIDLDLIVIKEYTENAEEMKTVDVTVAKNEINEAVTETIESEEAKKKYSVNGVLLASKPVEGIVSSRFGATNGRNHSHKGIDIAATTGTPIHACGDGVVTRAGWSNGYGNLVVISHGNGVETYYGHCSKLYVTTGQKVSSNEKIAAVGSTGNSTGPHLHLEIRKNGTQINPQVIFYK